MTTEIEGVADRKTLPKRSTRDKGLADSSKWRIE